MQLSKIIFVGLSQPGAQYASSGLRNQLRRKQCSAHQVPKEFPQLCSSRRELAFAATVTQLPISVGYTESYKSLEQGYIKEQLPKYIETLDDRLSILEKNQYPVTRIETDARIVAVGDLHGDLKKTVEVLEEASVLQVIDGNPVWVGGDTVVVQVGDVLDRGDSEIAILMLLRELNNQAAEQGGQLVLMNGNHESLNLCGTYRYVTMGALRESALVAGVAPHKFGDLKELEEARRYLFSPGGPVARDLSHNSTVLIVNDTVFVHGGLVMEHVKYGISTLNRQVAEWMRGDIIQGAKAAPPYQAMGDSESIMWNRRFGTEVFPSQYDQKSACIELAQVLDSVGAARMVVGHTPQVRRGANCECDGRVYRIDVGMSRGMVDRDVEFLQIDKKENGLSECQIYVHGRGFVGDKQDQQSGSSLQDSIQQLFSANW